MSSINKQALRYGDNVLWFLNELAAYDAGDIDGGEFDVYGEDRNGLEGCSAIDVTDLAADAAKLIEAADKHIAEQREYYEGVIADGSRRIAELEAREVKLPPTFLYEHDDLPREIPVLSRRLVINALREAGIKIAAGIGKGE